MDNKIKLLEKDIKTTLVAIIEFSAKAINANSDYGYFDDNLMNLNIQIDRYKSLLDLYDAEIKAEIEKK